MLTRLRRAPRGDDGVTLIELVVSTALSLILGTVALTWFVLANRVTRSSADDDTVTAGARTVLQSWSQLLTVAAWNPDATVIAQRVVNLTPTSITFYANLANLDNCAAACADTSPTLVTLAFTDERLQQDTGSGTHVVLADPASTTGCLFTAYDAGNDQLGCGEDSAPGAEALAGIERVEVRFRAKAQTGREQSFQLSVTFTGQRPAVVPTGSA